MSTKTHIGDIDFVDKILDGDARSWNDFVDRFSDRIWRRSWQLCNEACPHAKGSVYCVFHALSAASVQPTSDDRPGCDEGLEIYAFIFDYLFNQKKHTGKLKHYDGRAELETFISSVMHGNMRTDWIRHNRKLRVDQITLPPEVQRLEGNDSKVFEQMVMQRPTETIARNVGMSVEETMAAQERVTHALMTNGNLHLVLRNAEGHSDEIEIMPATRSSARILPMKRAVNEIWERVCMLIKDLPEPQKILLTMAFDEELDAKEILQRCLDLELDLPVKPRTGKTTIHTIYQSIDFVLKELGVSLSKKYPELLREARDWLDDDSISKNISVKGLKALLKNMGLQGVTASQSSRIA